MFTFGSDPEFMVVKDGKYHAAFKMIQGDTENRIDINGHQFYYDNVMAECAIKPGSSKQEVIENVGECLSIYADMVRPFKLVAQASQEYPADELEDERAKNAGCSPDWCAYAMKLMDTPKELIRDGNLRSCGGHIHLGSPFLMKNGPDPWRVIYMMDLFLGIPSLWLDKDPTSTRRRQLYGQAGRYRLKEKYGLEYRSLGNFWLTSPAMVGLIYDLCEYVLGFVESGKAAECWEFNEEVFYSSSNLPDAWTCHWYEPDILKAKLDANDKNVPLGLSFLKAMLPKSLHKDLIKICDADPVDLYTGWGLTC